MPNWFDFETGAGKRAQVLTWLLGFLVAATILCLWFLTTSTADDIAGVEPYVVYTLSELTSGLPLYKHPEQPPFSVTQYAPLYYLLVDSLAAMTHSTTALELTRLGRSVSACFLLAQVVLSYNVCRLWLNIPGFIASLVVTALVLTTAPWQVCARPDSMLSFFSLLTLVCVLKSTISPKRSRWLVVAATFACASVFVKQSGVVNLACLFVWAFVGRRLRDVLWVFGTTSVTLTVGLGWCFGVWGDAFFANVVTGVRNGINLDPAMLDTFTTLTGLYLPILTAGVWLSSTVLWQRDSQPQLRVLAVFGLVTLVVSSVLALKRGAAINYFNDYFTVALLLVAAVVNARAFDIPRSVRPVIVTSLGVWLSTLFVRNLAVPVGYARAARGGEHDYEVLMPLAEQLRSELRAEDAYALTRHPGLAAALAPYSILPMPAITDQLYADGILDSQVLESWLAHNRVSRTITERTSVQWYGPVDLKREWCSEEVRGTLLIHKQCGN